ncbi:DNA-binding transcriptional regulator, LysR family [Noviherbaspirillum humi]|uniref:DNA-binding transcriptional regulator, LysR family n=2 Tax=Noviherbaspirillum humi TaxID=1688639 RepID=A0A239JTY1_9BURK|nr:DNA-binding transcriptional regulator, LysR family [Noviherbaspirillum humi]
MNISTRHLKAFLALAERKSFTRAADAVHLSQPAFSMLIQSLEESVGLRLFDRGPRHVELTAEGEAFAQAAERLLGDFEGLLAQMKDLVALQKGRVAVAALPSLSASLLPPVIARFRQRHPGVELALHDVTSDDCLDLVRRGRCDIALTAIAQSDELDIEPVLADSFYVVCPRRHPLAARKRIRRQDLLEYGFIQQDRASSVRQQIDAVMFPARLKTVMEVSNMNTAVGLVGAEVGIAIVPAVALFLFRQRHLARIPLADPAFTRSIALVRLKGRRDTTAVAAFVALLKEGLQQGS